MRRVLIAGSLAALAAAAPAGASTGGYSPAWSPDGSRIAYVGPARTWIVAAKTGVLTETPGTNRVIVVAADGRGSRRVLAHAPRAEILYAAAWAAGGRIVYDDSDFTLWSGGPAGKRPTRLATTGDTTAQVFALSPDRSQVAFTAPCECGVAQGTEVGVVAVAGGRARILPHPANALDSHPSFSADGRRIVFSRTLVGRSAPPWPRNQSIVVEPVGGGRARRLHVGGDRPAYSPNGRWIAFLGRAGIELMPAAGGKARRLLPFRHVDGTAAFSWSPDSRRLAFAGATTIGTVDLRGHATIFSLPGLRPGTGTPQWSPDGTSIAFSAIRKGNGLRAGVDTRVYVIRSDGGGLRRVA